MFRTPLIREISKRLRQIHVAHSVGQPVAALREAAAAQVQRIEPGRRELLRLGAMAPLALAMPKWSYAASQPRIAIVGGGIAGLTCALKLADRGIASTLYEAGQRVGGRMFSNRSGYWADGQLSEWGGELIDTGHTTIRALARRFGLQLDNVHQAQAKGSEDTFYLGGRYYTQSNADQDFAAMYAALQADMDAAPFPTLYDNYTPEAYALDHMSVYQWIETRVPGGHASSLGQLLDLAYATEYGADTTDQSALNILYLLGFQPDSTGQSLSMFGESDERFHIRGGNDQIPLAIAKCLGGTVQLGKRLISLRQRSSGDYQMTFDVAGTTETIKADVVVLAIPFAVLRTVDIAQAGFDARKLQTIHELGRGVGSKLQLQFDQRVWRGTGVWPGKSTGSSYADTGYQASWEVTRAQPGLPGIINFFSGGRVAAGMHTNTAFATARNATMLADARRALEQVAPVWPGLSWNGNATQSLWHKNPLAQLSYAYYRVGQYTRFGGYEKAPQGKVLFCGEHTSTDFQGFMEGGAAEGVRAAGDIVAAIKGRAAA